MDLNEKIVDWAIEDGIIILEPQEEFNCRIIGVTEDKCHLIYSYQKLTTGMAEKYFREKKEGDERTMDDCLSEACEWVDYNTIRSFPYMNEEYRPIIIYEFEGD